MSFKFVLLTFKDHPAARLMLRYFLRSNLVPSCIIEEDSAFGRRMTGIFENSINPHQIENMTDLTSEYEIQRVTVDNINFQETIDILNRIKPDLLVIGKCRIIKPEIFTLCKDGCINAHPGLLPEIKGSFPQIWSVLNNIPVGCTTHLIDEDIDTGPLLEREVIPVTPSDTLEDIMEKSMVSAASLINTVLFNYKRHHKLSPIPQPESSRESMCYKAPSVQDIEKAREKLDSGEYYNTVYKDQNFLPGPAL